MAWPPRVVVLHDARQERRHAAQQLALSRQPSTARLDGDEEAVHYSFALPDLAGARRALRDPDSPDDD